MFSHQLQIKQIENSRYTLFFQEYVKKINFGEAINKSQETKPQKRTVMLLFITLGEPYYGIHSPL